PPSTPPHLPPFPTRRSSDLKTPQWMAERAGEVARDNGLQMTVWDEQALQEQGFGAILGVGRGASRPPRLVQLSYVPENPSAHVVDRKSTRLNSSHVSISYAV